MNAAGRRGFTLIELMVALVIGGIILGAAYQLLRNNQRFYRSQAQVVDVQSNVRAVAQMLPAELREISGSGGDILAMSDTALTVRAARGLGIVCATPDTTAGTIVLRSSQWYSYRAIDPTRDGIYVFRDGDTLVSSDDRWLSSSISSTSTVVCADASAGTRVTLTGMSGGFGQMGRVYHGAPVRTYETVRYRLYSDAGTWWLGVSTLASGAWTATSPVAGPLRANDGLRFQYLTAAGGATTDSSLVRQIVVDIRGRSAQPIQMQGRPSGRYDDSLTVRTLLRGN